MRRLSLLLLFTLIACGRKETAAPIGDANRGRQLISQYGCNVCHTIPGIQGPQGAIGPALDGIASRPRISYETVVNTQTNLVQFIQKPSSLNPNTAMPPPVGITPEHAKDIAAYLLTLK